MGTIITSSSSTDQSDNNSSEESSDSIVDHINNLMIFELIPYALMIPGGGYTNEWYKIKSALTRFDNVNNALEIYKEYAKGRPRIIDSVDRTVIALFNFLEYYNSSMRSIADQILDVVKKKNYDEIITIVNNIETVSPQCEGDNRSNALDSRTEDNTISSELSYSSEEESTYNEDKKQNDDPLSSNDSVSSDNSTYNNAGNNTQIESIHLLLLLIRKQWDLQQENNNPEYQAIKFTLSKKNYREAKNVYNRSEKICNDIALQQDIQKLFKFLECPSPLIERDIDQILDLTKKYHEIITIVQDIKNISSHSEDDSSDKTYDNYESYIVNNNDVELITNQNSGQKEVGLSNDQMVDKEKHTTVKRVLNFGKSVSKTIHLTESSEKIENNLKQDIDCVTINGNGNTGKSNTISSIQNDYTLSSDNLRQKEHEPQYLLVHKNTVTREEFGAQHNVPADGNCLFWSIFYAYLLPVRKSHEEFKERFKKMFPGRSDLHNVSSLQNKFQSLELNNLNTQVEDFIPLIQELRKRAYDEVKHSISTGEKIHVTPTKNKEQHIQWTTSMADVQYNKNGIISEEKYWGEEKAINALACLLDINIVIHHSITRQQYPANLNKFNSDGTQILLPISSDIEITLKLQGKHYNFYYKDIQWNEVDSKLNDTRTSKMEDNISTISSENNYSRKEESTYDEFDSNGQTITANSNKSDLEQKSKQEENTCTTTEVYRPQHFNNDFENKSYKSLHDAAKNGDISVVNDLLTKGTDVNALDQNNWTALHFAARSGHDNVVKLLLDHNAKVDATTLDNWTALHLAAYYTHISVIYILLKYQAYINITNDNGYTPLNFIHLKIYHNKEKLLAIITPEHDKGYNYETKSYFIKIVQQKKIFNITLKHIDNNDSIQFFVVYDSIDTHINAQQSILIKEGLQNTPLDIQYSNEVLNVEVIINKLLNNNDKEKLLHLAATEKGYSHVVEALLTEGIDVNALDHKRLTALHLAARHGYDNIVEMLLEHKADIINIQTSFGSTALHLAAINKHIAVITVLLNKGADINIANNDGHTPAHYLKYLEHLKLENLNIDHLNLNTDVNNMCLAVITRDISVVNTLLLTEGVDVNALDHKGWTVLHYAVRNGNDNIVQLLLKHGANVGATAPGQWTALHYAARNGNDNIVQLLLKHGANVGATAPGQWTALHYAARNGNDGIVAMLLEHNADIINTQNSNGSTALHLAAINKCVKVIQVLLQKEANINIANNDGYTPAHYLKYLEHLKLENLNIDHLNLNTDVNNMCLAVITRDISVVNTLLLTEGVDVNALDHKGWTALHYAARNGNDNIVQLLLKHGANVGATAPGQWTALHLAAQNGNDGIVAMLLEHNADITNTQNSNGSTALHLASMYQHKKVVKVLLDNELIDISISDNNGNTSYDLSSKVAKYYCPEIIDLFQSKQHTSETGSLKTDNTAISNNLADCGLKFNPNLNNESISDFQQPELHEKQDLNALPINTNNDQGEVSSLYKQEIYKEKLSIAKKLLESGIIVDIIIKCVGLSEETVEKLRKDNVDFNNDKELVTQSKSLESSRNVLDEEEYPGIKYDVPGDGNCLFWSIFYAYLFPVRNSNKEFQKRFNKMFPDHDYNSLQDVQNKFQSLELDDLKNQDQDFILLIQKLRRRAYDEVKNSIDTTDQIHVTPSKKGVQHRQWAEAMAKADYNGSAYIANNYWGEEKAINALACLLDIKIKEQHSNQHYPYNLCNPLNETGHQNLLPVESDIEVTLLNINGHYNFYYKNKQCNSSHTESDVQTDNDGMATKSKQLSNDDKGLQTSINDTNAVNIFNLSKYSITNTKENINIRDIKSEVDLTKDQNNQKVNFQSELSSQQLANDCTIPISTINDRGEVRLYDNQTVNKEKYSTAKRVLNFSERALVSNTNTYNNTLVTIEIDISSNFIIEKLNIKRNLKSNKSLGDHIIPFSIFSKIIEQFFQNARVVDKAEYFYKVFIRNYRYDQNIGQIIEKIKDKKIPQEIEKCFKELISSIINIWDQGLTSKYYGPKTQKELASEGGKVSSIGKKIGTILSENTLPKNFDEFKKATTEIKSHLLETIDLPSIIRKDINDQSEVQNYIQNILFISCTIIENKLKYQDKNNIKIIKNALETRKTLEKNKLLKYVKSIIQHKYEDEIVKIVKILEEFLEQKIQWIEVQKLLKVEIYNLIKWYFKEIIINVREHLQLFVLILNMRTSFCDEEEGDYQRFMNDLYDEENLAESLLNKQKSILDDRKTVLQGMYSDKPIDQYYSEPTESTSGSNGKYYDITGTDHQDSTFTFEQYLNNKYDYNWCYDISNIKGIKIILDHLLKVNSKIYLFDDSKQPSKVNEINNAVLESIKPLIIKSEHSYPEQALINCYVIIIKDNNLALEQNIIKLSLIAIKYEDEKVLLQETDILNVNEESNKTIINLDSPFINNGQVEYKSTVLCNDGNDFKYKQPIKMEHVISSIQKIYNLPKLQFKLDQHLEVINSQCIQANTLVINYYLEQFKKIQHILNTHHNNTLLQEEDINKLTDDTFDKSPLEMYMFYLLNRYNNCSSIPKPKLDKLIQSTYRYKECQDIWNKYEQQITSTNWFKDYKKEVYNPAQEKLTLSHLSTNSNSTWHNNDDNNKLLLGDSTDVTVL